MTKAKAKRKVSGESLSERGRMARLVAGLSTKAAKIRRLGAAGYKRQAIADFLGISYQHARNVLVQPTMGQNPYDVPPSPAPRGVAEAKNARYAADTQFDAETGVARFNIDDLGRITLTPALLKALGAGPGQIITARFEDGELSIMGLEAMLRFVRRGIPPWKPGDPLWSDELIAERRAEAAREDRKYRKWRRKSS